MKKLLILLFMFIAFNVYAASEATLESQNGTAIGTTTNPMIVHCISGCGSGGGGSSSPGGSQGSIQFLDVQGTVNAFGGNSGLYYSGTGSTPGNVGVGTNLPNHLFDVVASDTNTNLTTASLADLEVGNSNSTIANNFQSIDLSGANTSGTFKAVAKIAGVNTSHTAGSESGDFVVLTKSAGTTTEKMRVTGLGNVGIGSVNPAALLDVNGSIRTTSFYAINGSTALSMPVDTGNAGYSFAMGTGALPNFVSGMTDMIAIGGNTLSTDSTSSDGHSIAIGQNALSTENGQPGSIAIGFNALQNFQQATNVLTGDPVAIGLNALQNETTGVEQTAIGTKALAHETTGAEDTAVGFESQGAMNGGSFNVSMGGCMIIQTTGSGNTCMGTDAMRNVLQVGGATAIGDAALKADTNNTVNANDVTAVGDGAMLNWDEAGTVANPQPDNVAVGFQALAGDATLNTGIFDVGLGAQTGFIMTSGSFNTIVGTKAGFTLTSGSDNTIIGNQVANQILATGSGNIVIGTTTPTDTVASNTSHELNIGNTLFGNLQPAGSSTGYIGIGTAIPQVTLDVEGTVQPIVFDANPGTGNVGIGSRSPGALLDIQGTLRITGAGHISSSSTPPTVASNVCGSTTQGTIVAKSTDTAGTVTVGTLTVTSCAVTFAHAWNSVPVCVANDDTNVLAIRPTETNTGVTFTSLSSASGDNISWVCIGNE